MRLTLAAICATLIAGPAFAGPPPIPVPAPTPYVTTYLSVKGFPYNAKGDAQAFTDGTFTNGSSAFSSATATFSPTDVGKTIQIDGASGIVSAPLVTTIASYVDATHITLGANPTASSGLNYLSDGVVVTARAAGSYIPADVLCITGGTSSVGACLKVLSTTATSFVQNANGSGGTNGACVLTGTTGTGTLFQVNATIAGGAVSSLGSTAVAGHYVINPTSVAAEPVTSSCGGLVGATLTLTMGVDVASVSVAGNYTVLPSNAVATGAGSISGATGATFTASWTTTGTFVYGTDDSAAVKSAINAAMTQATATGKRVLVYMPAANYYIGVNTLPVMYRFNGGIVGDGHNKTNIIVGANYTGDLFSWSEAWLINSAPFNAPMGFTSSSWAGPTVQGLTINGDRLAGTTQNAMVFYDRNDFVSINDVHVRYLNGRCLYSGVVLNTVQAYMRESNINVLKCFNDGAAASPVIEFNSQGAGDASNEIDVADVDIYASYGTGLVLRSNGGNLRDFKFTKLRIEGLERDAANITADLFVLGDSTQTGLVSNIMVTQFEGIDPYLGQAAVRVTAAGASSQPYAISVSGSISGGRPLGYGVIVNGGRLLNFQLSQLGSYNTNVTLSASPTVGTQIYFDGGGAEQGWSYNVDPTSAPFLTMPTRRFGNPSIQTGAYTPYFSINNPDNTIFGGNPRGVGSVDLQQSRLAAAQACTGQFSVCLGGQNNTNSGFYSVVAGQSNKATTYYGVAWGSADLSQSVFGWALGGFAVTNNYGQMAWATGSFLGIQGNAEWSNYVLRGAGSTTAAIRVTADQLAASNLNVANINNNALKAVTITVSAQDYTAPANTYVVVGVTCLMRQGANAAATVVTCATFPVALTTGTGATAAIAVTADTTNGGLNIGWTPPAANTDTWHVVANVQTVDTF
jgi:hypothetical protein